jgi:hypothetical protein
LYVVVLHNLNLFPRTESPDGNNPTLNRTARPCVRWSFLELFSRTSKCTQTPTHSLTKNFVNHYNKNNHGTMKPVSHAITLNNSLLQAMSNTTTNNSRALPVPTPPTTSPESEEAQRKRLVEILEFTIAMIDDFDFDPNGPSESHTTLGQ